MHEEVAANSPECEHGPLQANAEGEEAASPQRLPEKRKMECIIELRIFSSQISVWDFVKN